MKTKVVSLNLGLNYRDSVSRKWKSHKIPQTLAREGLLTKLMQTRRIMREKDEQTNTVKVLELRVYM